MSLESCVYAAPAELGRFLARSSIDMPRLRRSGGFTSLLGDSERLTYRGASAIPSRCQPRSNK